jgi:hypothetical protein
MDSFLYWLTEYFIQPVNQDYAGHLVVKVR